MNTPSSFIKRFTSPGWLIVGLGLILLAVYVQWSPLIKPIPSRDSGVFLYVGQQMLNGAVPYRDVWDHKGLVLYALNALALWIGGGSLWSIWGIEFTLMLAAVVLAFRFLHALFGKQAAFVACLLMILSLFYTTDGGNFSEDYAFVLQVAAFYLLWRALERRERAQLGSFGVIGAMGAAAFFLRPNLIGTFLVIGLYLALQIGQRENQMIALRRLLALISGAALVTAVIALYVLAHHISGEMIDAFLRYNLLYSSETPPTDRLEVWRNAVSVLRYTGLVPFGALGAAAYGFSRFQAKPILWIVLADLLLETTLILISGWLFAHYLVLLLFPLSVFTAYGLAAVRRLRLSEVTKKAIWVVIACFVAACVCFFGLTAYTAHAYFEDVGTPVNDAVRFINAHAQPDDTVLIWGAESVVNFLTQRPAPTRFAYQLPFRTPGYLDAAIADEFIEALERRLPAYVIDTYYPYQDGFIILDAEQQAAVSSFSPSPELNVIAAYLREHYHAVETLVGGWRVYARNGDIG